MLQLIRGDYMPALFGIPVWELIRMHDSIELKGTPGRDIHQD